MTKKERIRAITETEVRANKDSLVRVHVLDHLDVLNGSVPRSEFRTIGRNTKILASLVTDILCRTWDGTYHVVRGDVLLRLDSGDDLFAADRKTAGEFVELLPQLREWIDARLILGVARVLEGHANEQYCDNRMSAAREVILRNRNIRMGQDQTRDDIFDAWLRKVSRAIAMTLKIATVDGREETIYIPPKSQTQNPMWIDDPYGNQISSRKFIVTSMSRYLLVGTVNGVACLLPWEQAKDLREGDRVIIHRRHLLGAHYHARADEVTAVRGSK